MVLTIAGSSNMTQCPQLSTLLQTLFSAQTLPQVLSTCRGTQYSLLRRALEPTQEQSVPYLVNRLLVLWCEECSHSTRSSWRSTISSLFSSSKGTFHTSLSQHSSLLLLLLLVLYGPRDDPSFFNPYLSAFRRLKNSQLPTTQRHEASVDEDSFFAHLEDPSLAEYSVDFDAIRWTICNNLAEHSVPCSVLLCLLIRENAAFPEFLFPQSSSSLVENNTRHLLLQMLQSLDAIQAPEHLEASPHLPLLSSLMALFTEHSPQLYSSLNSIFISSADVPWFKHTALIVDMPMLSFMLLVLLRCLPELTTSPRCLQLCLHMIANLSAHCKHMHTYTAQKFLTSLRFFCRKYNKSLELIKNHEHMENASGVQPPQLLQAKASSQQMHFTFCLLLQSIHCILIYHLESNLSLIYELVQQKSSIEFIFRQAFSNEDIVKDVQLLLSYFESELKSARNVGDSSLSWSVEEVMECIKRVASAKVCQVAGSLQNLYLPLNFADDPNKEKEDKEIYFTMVEQQIVRYLEGNE